MVKMTESSRVADYIAESSEANWITPLGIPSSLNHLANIEKGNIVADMGGGTGKLGKKISEERPEADVLVTDVSRQASEEAAKELDKASVQNGSHHVIQTSGLKGLKDSYFSQIYAVNVLQAMDNPGKGLRQVYDKLEESGKAVATVPGEESAEIFPQKAVRYDEDLDLPYIQVPGVLEGDEISYSQYILPEEWMEETIEDIGFRVKDKYPEKILSDPTGLTYMSKILDDDYSPDIPVPAAMALEKIPSGTVRKTLDYLDKGPEVDLWVMEK